MSQSDHRKVIYLAGGFKSGWQNKVMTQLPSYDFLDPSLHNIQDAAEYTRWDLDAIRASDIVFGYMESTNPGGYSLALEIGFAHALGKAVLFVDEIKDPSVSRYFEMVRQCSDNVFTTLSEAIEYLRKN
ncbi:nucleoside 2-deoxyribosyltransferase domain-containing protein [Undibacterium sp. Di27W]|uniref:nucleoside 2-deoxyribosyltransferase domain-containing protein n=1 Tax=Undibacterium sp. Di27W TaxID=3413036 RepID=UPI003BF331EB